MLSIFAFFSSCCHLQSTFCLTEDYMILEMYVDLAQKFQFKQIMPVAGPAKL